MWQNIYNTGIWMLKLAYTLAGLFSIKASDFINGRKGVLKNLSAQLGANRHKLIWIHAASIGEFEQGRPLIEILKKEFPAHKVLLSFFSPSGYNTRKNYPLADYVCYLPLDTPKNAREFIRITKPIMAVFVKYEFWHNYIKELSSHKIPVISISTKLRGDQIYFKWYGKYFANILRRIDHFFVQDHDTADLLKKIDIKQVTITGDTRFDRIKNIIETAEEIPSVQKFKNNRKLLIGGSVWREDMEVISPFINLAKEEWCFIIAPHEITENFLVRIEKDLEHKSIRFSSILHDTDLSTYKVLIIDNIGMLSKIYRYADFAFIGGSFGKGLHNIVEASSHGIPVFFGNQNYRKFREAVDLIKLGGAFAVLGFDDFNRKIKELEDPEKFKLIREVVFFYVMQNFGATEKIMKYCRTKLSSI